MSAGHDETLLGPAAGAAAAAPAHSDSSVAGDALAAGTMVGEYRIDREIGRGGMGTVYSADHPVIGKRVAIKVLAPALSSDPAVVKRFVDEARAANKIGHPNIIDIFSFGQLRDGRQYFVMEYLEGETLGARIERGPLLAAEARRFLVQTCEALEAAHREQIVHRDLKPENIWIARPKHGEPFIKVLDFGIAKLLQQTETLSATQTGTVMGTPFYMSPEQCTGRGVDHRTDIYAMGVMLYRIFAGRLPFEGQSFAEIVALQLTARPELPGKFAKLPAALETLILECLEKDSAKRPQSAAELGRRVEEALGGARGAAAAAAYGSVPTEGPGAGGATGGGDTVALAAPETQQGFVTQGETAAAVLAPRPAVKALIALAVVGVVAGIVAAVMVSRKDERAAAGTTTTVPVAPGAMVPAPSAVAAPMTPLPSPTAPTTAAEARPQPVARPQPKSANEATRRVAAPTAPGEKRASSRAEKQGLVRENPFQ